MDVYKKLHGQNRHICQQPGCRTMVLGSYCMEHLEERAGIQEYDGGLTREQAETEARRTLRVYRYRLRDPLGSDLILIAPGESLDEARKGLRLKHGDRLIDVTDY